MSLIGLLLRGFGGNLYPNTEPAETTNQLDHSPADVIRWLLIDLDIGTDPDDQGLWPIFCDGEGDNPDNVVTVYNTSGVVQGEVQFSGEIQEHYGLQFRVRGNKSTVAWSKMNELALSVDQQINNNTVTVDGTQYYVECVARTGTVFALGKMGDGKRYVYTLNATVSLRQIVS